MYQNEYQKTCESREDAIGSIVPKENLWYNADKKNATDSSTLTIESNPCFRILQPNSNHVRGGSSDIRLQKTVVHIVHRKKDSELLNSIFNCMYEILSSKSTPAINSE